MEDPLKKQIFTLDDLSYMKEELKNKFKKKDYEGLKDISVSLLKGKVQLKDILASGLEKVI